MITSNFPSGHFSIVNQETSRCLRVRLGNTVDLGALAEGVAACTHCRPDSALGFVDG
ncbi:hypothetical protein [Streptomyces sennicomposti]